jgi:hypothetical protein
MVILGTTLGLLWSVFAENHPDFITRDWAPFCRYFYSVIDTFLPLPFKFLRLPSIPATDLYGEIYLRMFLLSTAKPALLPLARPPRDVFDIFDPAKDDFFVLLACWSLIF